LVENYEPLLFADRRQGMGSNRTELTALKNLLSQADRIFETFPALPENRTGACRELLETALALTDDLLKHSTTPAALMGSKGGSTTARHGSEHYRQMAARRKTHGGAQGDIGGGDVGSQSEEQSDIGSEDQPAPCIFSAGFFR
jgi:hypothetical protein